MLIFKEKQNWQSSKAFMRTNAQKKLANYDFGQVDAKLVQKVGRAMDPELTMEKVKSSSSSLCGVYSWCLDWYEAGLALVES